MNIYVIGPVTGRENGNREEFLRVRAILREAGHRAEIPHSAVSPDTSWQAAMGKSISMMLNTTSSGNLLYEAIAMLDGWEESKGACIEHDLAEALGIECRPWREWL